MNSDETPINPYRVYGDLMEVLDLKNSFVTHESGNTRDQLITVFDTLIPRGFLGWGNVSTLGFSLAAAIAAKKAFPGRASVAVTGEAGLGYMLGNLEVLLREKLGVTVVHISNGGFAGYGPGFWGPGHDPFTHRVLGPDEVDMSKVIGALGFHTERVSEPAEIIPALRRALEINNSGRPAYIEFICCQYPVYGQWVGRGEGSETGCNWGSCAGRNPFRQRPSGCTMGPCLRREDRGKAVNTSESMSRFVIKVAANLGSLPTVRPRPARG